MAVCTRQGRNLIFNICCKWNFEVIQFHAAGVLEHAGNAVYTGAVAHTAAAVYTGAAVCKGDA
eukprot:5054529-Pyramimonas_sp.AAC.1